MFSNYKFSQGCAFLYLLINLLVNCQSYVVSFLPIINFLISLSDLLTISKGAKRPDPS